MSALNSFNETLLDYHAPRRADEPDLVLWLRTLLCQAGLDTEVLHHYDTSHYIVEAADKNPRVQRFMLNQFWNLQLMACPAISINERYCLIYQGAIEDWQKLIADSIVPFAALHRLPMALGHDV